MPSIGPMELIVVLVIALVVLGPKRLPGLGKQLGTGMREFKEGISGNGRDDDDEPRALPASERHDPVTRSEPVAEPADESASRTSA